MQDLDTNYTDPITGEVDWIAMARDEGCSPCTLCGWCVGGDCPYWTDCRRCGSVMPDAT